MMGYGTQLAYYKKESMQEYTLTLDGNSKNG